MNRVSVVLSPHVTLAAAVIAVGVLGGCATTSQDSGFGAVESVAQQRLGKELRWIRSGDQGVLDLVVKLLAEPLSVDAAVQVALLNNRGLQATYSELGIAEADLVQASRLRNPGFSFTNIRGGDAHEIDLGLSFDFLQLLTLPIASRIEARRFEQTKLLVGDEVLRVAGETRKAWFSSVAAAETVRYMEQVKTAAEAGALLAKQMVSAGNWSKLDQSREQAFFAEATAQFLRAEQGALAEREKLTRLMGLSGQSLQFTLPQRLPELPGTRPSLDDVEAFAMAQRLDLQAAKLRTQSLAAALGLTKTTRFINVLEAGPVQLRDAGSPTKNGYQISVELPLFDWGGARVARAEALYMQSVNRVAEAAINARSEVRENYSGYLSTYDVAKHYRDDIVPLRKNISDELLLRYNGMLVSVFELLADAREQVTSVNASIDALKSFWLAETELEIALGGRLAPSVAPTGVSPTPPAADPPARDSHQHHKQGSQP